MTELKNMMITDEALENINGGETKLSGVFSPCKFGYHEIPRDVRTGFYVSGSYYWLGECPKCGKVIYAQDHKEISKREFDEAWNKWFEQ